VHASSKQKSCIFDYSTAVEGVPISHTADNDANWSKADHTDSGYKCQELIFEGQRRKVTFQQKAAKWMQS
jgi:hypothetical protein